MPKCQQAIVTIQTVSVAKAESFGFLGEPGSSAEWELQFNVAGQQAVIRFDGTHNGSVLTVNRPFLVDLGPLQSLFIQVSGVEIDDTSANDSLPTAMHQITPATNWAEGQTFTFAAASHEDFAYSVTVDIRCAASIGSAGSALTQTFKQSNWRWCFKCTGLHFAGGGSLGVCPTGGAHSINGSGNYNLMENSPPNSGQHNWRWCQKCNGLFFAGLPLQGVCAAGGAHDGTQSGDYSLVDSIPQDPGQHQWRWCNKCSGLHFIGNEIGTCPSGGTHSTAGSGDYSLQII